MLGAALSHIEQGFKVFPEKSDKTPLTEHGLKDCTQIQVRVKEFWGRWPNAGIGLDVFAYRRISQIASLVGEENVQQAIAEVVLQFREHEYNNMRLWQIFQKGDQAQQKAVRHKYQSCVLNGPEEATARWAFAPNMTLSSPSFTECQSIPGRYTSQGLNISPSLAWSAPPDGTQSLVITMHDMDSYKRLISHWMLFNIPPDLRELPEAISLQGQLPSSFLQGENDYGKIGYYGPRSTSPFHRTSTPLFFNCSTMLSFRAHFGPPLN